MNAPFLHASNAYESTSKRLLYEPQNHQLQYRGTQPYNGTDMILEQVPPLQHYYNHCSAPSLDRQTEMPTPAGTSKRHLYEPQNHQHQYGGAQPYNGADMIVEQVPPLQRYHHHHYSAPSLVQTEMPSPAKKPPMPKSNFTPADDKLLVNLKEHSSLTWKEIAESFPGRSAGTLQVRYCTKLKARTPQWTNETTQKLRLAIQDYEQNKWVIIAGKMGRGFTGKVCQDKANQL